MSMYFDLVFAQDGKRVKELIEGLKLAERTCDPRGREAVSFFRKNLQAMLREEGRY